MALTTGFIYKSRRVWDESRFPGRDGVILSYLVDAANFTDIRLDDLTIHAGQILTSIPTLAKRLGYTEKQIRVTLDHLVRGGELVIKTAYDGALNGRKNGTLISVEKYRVYTDSRSTEGQINGEEQGSETAYNRATNNQFKAKETNINNSFVPFHQPTLDEVKEYDRLNDLHRDPISFYNFHSPNWTDGNGNAIYDWRRYYRNWTNPGSNKNNISAQIARIYGGEK